MADSVFSPNGVPVSPPTVASAPSTSGTPGTFKGKSYRKTAADMAQDPLVKSVLARLGKTELNKATANDIMQTLIAEMHALKPKQGATAAQAFNKETLAKIKAFTDAAVQTMNDLQQAGFKPTASTRAAISNFNKYGINGAP